MNRLTALGATGLLRDFCDAGVLAVADVHVATRAGALGGETDERVLLAVALTVRGTRQGSVVFDLAGAASTVTPDEEVEGAEAVELAWPDVEGWVQACASSPLVLTTDGVAPLRMVGTQLWLARYWQQETVVADELLRRSATRPDDLDLTILRKDLDTLFIDAGDSDQRVATAVAALSRVSVVAGGPGTGKTTTIARLLAVLLRQHPGLRVALAAPTGKAAARVEEAIRSVGEPLLRADRDRLAALAAVTLHRLLKLRPGGRSRLQHGRDNRVPFDVVVVDECSMVSLTLMAHLLVALPDHARIVLVGDPDQLASVEAGAVLGDLVDPDDIGAAGAVFGEVLRGLTGIDVPVRTPAPDAGLRESVALLRTVRRFDAGGPIARLAELVRAGRAEEALALLQSGVPELLFHPSNDDEPLAAPALTAVLAQADAEQRMITLARAGDAEAAIAALEQHRLLCAHRSGPRGVRFWSDAIERRLAAADTHLVPRLDGRYAGQPLLVTANDYENELFNGDVGVVVQRRDELLAAFRRGSDPVLLPLVRLFEVRPMHAMTVHRAQGSQFDAVTVLLPHATSPLATRQTFYTAITRASRRVTVVGSPDAVHACIDRPAARATGLRMRLAQPGVDSVTTPTPHSSSAPP